MVKRIPDHELSGDDEDDESVSLLVHPRYLPLYAGGDGSQPSTSTHQDLPIYPQRPHDQGRTSSVMGRPLPDQSGEHSGRPMSNSGLQQAADDDDRSDQRSEPLKWPSAKLLSFVWRATHRAKERTSSSASAQSEEKQIDKNCLLLLMTALDNSQELKRLLQTLRLNPNITCLQAGDELFRLQKWGLWESPALELIANHMLNLNWTPLHVASSRSQVACTTLLLYAKANPNSLDLDQKTCLDVAGSLTVFEKGKLSNPNEYFRDVINLIINIGGCPGQRKDMKTPLHLAVEMEMGEALEKLLRIEHYLVCLDDSGETPLHLCMYKEYLEPLKLLMNEDIYDRDQLKNIANTKNSRGCTLLHAAVEMDWVAGVWFALDIGAELTTMADNGETAIHLAAAVGNLEILNILIAVAKEKDLMNSVNSNGDTILFKALEKGHLNCVKTILRNDASSIEYTLPGGVNVFHVAAKKGYNDILLILIDFYINISKKGFGEDKLALENLTATDGFGPLHYAIEYNHTECVETLIQHLIRFKDKSGNLRLQTGPASNDTQLSERSTPLHVAAKFNRAEIARLLLSYDKMLMREKNSGNELPLHVAIDHGSRDVISVLLSEGANLVDYPVPEVPKKDEKTSIEMIIKNLENSTEFLENVFDSYITPNELKPMDPNYAVKVDYNILMADNSEISQLIVIETLLKTGNKYGQKNLLVHPLVESFLHLKWKALLPFFFAIITCHACYVVSLTLYSNSVFMYDFVDSKDNGTVWLDSSALKRLNCITWAIFLYFSIAIVFLHEFHVYQDNKSFRYLAHLETCVKLLSIGLAIILPIAVAIVDVEDNEWTRHVASIAILLAWIQIMILLSRFPDWGFYVLMFGKVALNVIKILLTFSFLLVGFSLSFMIQMKSKPPFDGPFSAFIKTVVMMTSEFDYSSFFEDSMKASDNLNQTVPTGEIEPEFSTSSIVIFRLTFVVFLVLVAIVLMNLMVGVAVNDISHLELLGNIERLEKQAQFLITLDKLVYSKSVITSIWPRRVIKAIKDRRNIPVAVKLRPGKQRSKYDKMLPADIRDAIFNTVQAQKRQEEKENERENFKRLIYEAIAEIKQNVIDNAELFQSKDQLSIGSSKVQNKLRNLDVTTTGKEQILKSIRVAPNDIPKH